MMAKHASFSVRRVFDEFENSFKRFLYWEALAVTNTITSEQLIVNILWVPTKASKYKTWDYET